MALAKIERIVMFITQKLIDLSCKVHALPYKRVRQGNCCGWTSLQLVSVPRMKSITLHFSAWLWVATHWLVWTSDALCHGLGAKFFIHLIFITVLTIFFVHSLEITFNPDGLKSVQNRLEEMQSYFKKRWAHHPAAYLPILSFPGFGVAFASVYAAIYLWNPTLPMFFIAQAVTKLSNATLLPEKFVVQVVSKSIGACLELMIMLWIIICQGPIHELVLIIYVSFPMWLIELRQRMKNAARWGPLRFKREVQNCLKLYNTLRIFNIFGNDFIGRSILPAIPAWLIALTSSCLFCSIRLHDVLPLLLYAFFPAMTFFILTVVIPGIGVQLCAGSIHSTSIRRAIKVSVLKLQKGMLLTKMTAAEEQLVVIRKSLESLGPIRMQLGMFGSWEVTTMAGILQQIMSFTLLFLTYN